MHEELATVLTCQESNLIDIFCHCVAADSVYPRHHGCRVVLTFVTRRFYICTRPTGPQPAIAFGPRDY